MASLHLTLSIAVIVVLIERLTGYPPFLLDRIGHPVIWMGALLTRLETRFNRWPEHRLKGRASGLLALVLFLLLTGGLAATLTLALRILPGGQLVEALLATTLIAQRDLHRFVKAVAVGLDQSLEAGREAVSHIVGRDPQQLDGSGVARGALESLAENVWFGWAAARLDDLVNLPGSRLTGLLFAAAAALTRPKTAAQALEAMWRDAHKHVSPNAGWPEAALAGALDIRLGGPRSYEGRTVALAWMGYGRSDLSASDIRRGLRLYSRRQSTRMKRSAAAAVCKRSDSARGSSRVCQRAPRRSRCRRMRSLISPSPASAVAT